MMDSCSDIDHRGKSPAWVWSLRSHPDEATSATPQFTERTRTLEDLDATEVDRMRTFAELVGRYTPPLLGFADAEDS